MTQISLSALYILLIFCPLILYVILLMLNTLNKRYRRFAEQDELRIDIENRIMVCYA